MRHRISHLMVVITLSATCRLEAAENVAAELEKATAELATETYQLRYKFVAGETIRYQVEHLATVDTRIAGNSQKTKSRSVSTKAWKVTEATDGTFKFVHAVEDVDMWQKVSGRQEVRYNSRTDADPPAEYQHVAKSIGEPLAVVTIDGTGRIVARENKANHPALGFGGLVLPLPEGSIKLGQTWVVNDKLKIRERDGRFKVVSTRLRYRLEKVQTGVATISVRTQVLTPINDARLESQLIQQLSHGHIKFDVDAGRVISKQLDWDEQVIGFNGPNSNMKYLARFTESLVPPKTARSIKKTKTDL